MNKNRVWGVSGVLSEIAERGKVAGRGLYILYYLYSVAIFGSSGSGRNRPVGAKESTCDHTSSFKPFAAMAEAAGVNDINVLEIGAADSEPASESVLSNPPSSKEKRYTHILIGETKAQTLRCLCIAMGVIIAMFAAQFGVNFLAITTTKDLYANQDGEDNRLKTRNGDDVTVRRTMDVRHPLHLPLESDGFLAGVENIALETDQGSKLFFKVASVQFSEAASGTGSKQFTVATVSGHTLTWDPPVRFNADATPHFVESQNGIIISIVAPTGTQETVTSHSPDEHGRALFGYGYGPYGFTSGGVAAHPTGTSFTHRSPQGLRR